MEMQNQAYKQGEIVWAKVAGFPWWPGAVVEADVNQSDLSISTFVIKFFGEDSHSLLPFSKIAKYSDNYQQFSKKSKNNRKLRESLEMTQKIINGQLSLQNQLNRVKTTLIQLKTSSQKIKTAIAIEEPIFKEMGQTESTQISCNTSQVSSIKTEIMKKRCSIVSQAQQLSNSDKQILVELQEQEINQQNVVEILQNGFINRLSIINPLKAVKMKIKAKKVLLQKYFPKRTHHIQSNNSSNSNPSPKPSKTKHIHKPLKLAKYPTSHSQLQHLTILKLHQILKHYNIQTNISRSISTLVVHKLKHQYPISSQQFKKSFMNFIQWLRHHQNNSNTIVNCYNHYLQKQMQQKEEKREETTIC